MSRQDFHGSYTTTDWRLGPIALAYYNAQKHSGYAALYCQKEKIAQDDVQITPNNVYYSPLHLANLKS